jgi:hypothetical protein
MRYLIPALISVLSMAALSACASSAQPHQQGTSPRISSACPELEGYPDCQNGQMQYW